MVELYINGKAYRVNVEEETPLLWVIREHLGLTGTKFGCGKGICGACTVLVEDSPTRSCITPVKSLQKKRITTIEGIPSNHPVKVAWRELQVPQCGYCQPGQIVEAYALLKRNPKASKEEIVSVMSSHLCRCGTYGRILKAVQRAQKLMGVAS
ncbi:(2Fe-2S)-binding domain protein [Hydrogenobacter thermophilus TK-6]|uniref:Membrane-bound aldehyde dehydrogenase small subunit n=1 Tax=Hydrogenobacter thermophilus (strain DSM 6534 / IAM 12695 / TK-6) TaxID=608538 RepID=D3DI68_HYDTT|nr:(2Fe-2S)-binding protein [Hydrogenobacter thermophilus]ADO45449.1 (2Fe-2S)-binding domain protein [Hydrogenobacter thermophilus TK-6]BAI69520.1 membrane-bound aldehyde dehydrogenase small subunit [Hydrogenobacter thermophilus TK-6]